MLGANKGAGYPVVLMHFAIAERFGASPHDVLNVWDEELYREAEHLIAAERRWHKAHPGGSA